MERRTLLHGPAVVAVLKVAVTAVTLLLGASMVALWLGKPRWHGRINAVCLALTYATLGGLEVLMRIIQPGIFDFIVSDPAALGRLRLHLAFAVPAAVLFPILLITGYRGPRRWHLVLACVFGVVWMGTWLTGVLGLPHD
jgi:hypothetical protein